MADEGRLGETIVQEGAVDLGHDGAGSDCLGKAINFGWKGLLAGGGFGAVEGCFIQPVPGSTTPLVTRALKLIVGRAALGATVGGVFATTACLSASRRDKNDYMNAFLGGFTAGSIFGFTTRRVSIGLMVAFGLGTVCATIKYKHGTYLPPLPSKDITPQHLDLSSSSSGDD